ncbi:hypothetical protein JNW90_13680 [Micromonospora sp. STR1s_5]|nr:hypothetical protein [Micromonospora sp. STR1s_5]
MQDTDTADEATGTIEEAASAFESFLEPNGPTKTSRDVEEQDEAEDDESEAVDEDGTDEDEPSTEDEDEADEDSSTDDEDEDEDAEYDPDQLVTVKIDGKTEKVKLSEALASYQRQQDYSRKTQALAQERHTFQQEMDQVRQERAHYTQVINHFQQQLAQGHEELTQEQWAWLRANDPIEYHNRKDDLRTRQEQYMQLEQQKAWIAQQQAQAELQERNTILHQEREALFTKRPEWRDPKVFAKAQKEMREYAINVVGYSKEVVANITDHRAILALADSVKAHKLATKKPIPVSMNQKAPKRAPIQASESQTRPRKSTELQKAKQHQKRSGGSIDATTAVFERML